MCLMCNIGGSIASASPPPPHHLRPGTSPPVLRHPQPVPLPMSHPLGQPSAIPSPMIGIPNPYGIYIICLSFNAQMSLVNNDKPYAYKLCILFNKHYTVIDMDSLLSFYNNYSLESSDVLFATQSIQFTVPISSIWSWIVYETWARS